MTYDKVAGYDVLMQNVYGMNQEKAEKVQVLPLDWRAPLTRLMYNFLICGVHKTLRDSIRYMYVDPSISYTQLLAALQKAKTK